ncbi:hypothetical protein Taro_017382 [Colocasia esculenta]|uniref:Glucose-6-phosphate isomerase n=1 Tax=Colocasia esculenta TaxID=4460 RepID=A0A843UR78_COLES|nr:hypothetical protein [Colocasia esculenta]
MASSIYGICSSSSAFKSHKLFPHSPSYNVKPLPPAKWAPPPHRFRPLRSVARDTPPANLPTVGDAANATPLELKKSTGAPVEKDPIVLWRRYVDWLYQHKELGLFLDVSRIGFTDEFFDWMEPRMQKAFADMRELEKGAIANPDEGRMVGHYWLRNSNLAPNSFLKTKIETTLDAICEFANRVVNGEVGLKDAGREASYHLDDELKIKPPSSPAGRFTQVLSVGIGGSALGPQFVAEALAPDNPPLKANAVNTHELARNQMTLVDSDLCTDATKNIKEAFCA